jgi:hypothetical protein
LIIIHETEKTIERTQLFFLFLNFICYSFLVNIMKIIGNQLLLKSFLE